MVEYAIPDDLKSQLVEAGAKRGPWVRASSRLYKSGELLGFGTHAGHKIDLVIKKAPFYILALKEHGMIRLSKDLTILLTDRILQLREDYYLDYSIVEEF